MIKQNEAKVGNNMSSSMKQEAISYWFQKFYVNVIVKNLNIFSLIK